MAKKRKSEPHQPPRIGDYVAYPRPIEGRYHVSRKGKRKSFFDLGHEFIGTVETLRGAEKLAALLNQVRELGDDWRSVSTARGFDIPDNETWARGIIAHHVMKALGLKTDLEHPWRQFIADPTYDG